ncbi:coil containing protein [Vibrio phage 1.148.O._10N.286.54.A10]|nr:coil containing protein [Vibrio phage 1.148.O._10N.286.54.A10]AUR95400.1 coil containing protein [Vibrio phage 1.206.O._10N.222.51.B10]AUR96588.1 coil containing protein [Vibrio phage 1.226.O._10N.261.48.E5]
MDSEKLEVGGTKRDKKCCDKLKKRQEARRRIEELNEQRELQRLTDYLGD